MVRPAPAHTAPPTQPRFRIRKTTTPPTTTRLFDVAALVAIDPGLSGAVALFSPGGEFYAMRDMPAREKKSGRREVDPAKLAELLRQFRVFAEPRKLFCVIEQVAAMPGQGVSSMFSFGHSFGVAVGVAESLLVQTAYVAPRTWKKHLHLTKEKAYSLTLARQFYPAARQHLTRKKDEGRAEAILLGRYALLNWSTLF